MSVASAALAYGERLAWAVLPLRGKVPASAKGRGYLDNDGAGDDQPLVASAITSPPLP
jgi:hypothetical protein